VPALELVQPNCLTTSSPDIWVKVFPGLICSCISIAIGAPLTVPWCHQHEDRSAPRGSSGSTMPRRAWPSVLRSSNQHGFFLEKWFMADLQSAGLASECGAMGLRDLRGLSCRPKASSAITARHREGRNLCCVSTSTLQPLTATLETDSRWSFFVTRKCLMGTINCSGFSAALAKSSARGVSRRCYSIQHDDRASWAGPPALALMGHPGRSGLAADVAVFQGRAMCPGRR
jgi:hypothetical protein